MKFHWKPDTLSWKYKLALTNLDKVPGLMQDYDSLHVALLNKALEGWM